MVWMIDLVVQNVYWNKDHKQLYHSYDNDAKTKNKYEKNKIKNRNTCNNGIH